MINYFWFRRDLRLEDNAGLYHALKSNDKVQPVFIFDIKILERLSDKTDARVSFIHQSLHQLQAQLARHGSNLHVYYGNPETIWAEIFKKNAVQAVYCNRDYEPYALERDGKIATLAKSKDIHFKTYKDQVIFEKEEVLKADGTPYTVFTPYSKKWKARAQNAYYFKSYPSEKYLHHLHKGASLAIPTLEQMGFSTTKKPIPSAEISQGLIRGYSTNRDFPALDATSKLGIHFRFGTISIRQKARKAAALNEIFLNELIWRDFYSSILQAFPHVVHGAFRPAYDAIEWRTDEEDFQKWKNGQTGYPMVDAGICQLNETGFMHNRVRMITASFLTKHLLLDWRWGEHYFAEKLLDFDLASNNGGWQWASGSGTDAAPYFRIFNPEAQQKKFDPEFKYIKKWAPEFGTSSYPAPMVEHRFARQRCLEVYKAGLQR